MSLYIDLKLRKSDVKVIVKVLKAYIERYENILASGMKGRGDEEKKQIAMIQTRTERNIVTQLERELRK